MERNSNAIFYLNLTYLQLFRLNTKGQLGVGERCIAADRQNVKLVVCPIGTVDGPWQYESVCIIYNYFILTEILYFNINIIVY